MITVGGIIMRRINRENSHEYHDYLNLKIELFSGRPDREKIIGKNDIINLKIALNSQKTWEGLLKWI
jgi:hypothetical protein